MKNEVQVCGMVRTKYQAQELVFDDIIGTSFVSNKFNYALSICELHAASVFPRLLCRRVRLACRSRRRFPETQEPTRTPNVLSLCTHDQV